MFRESWIACAAAAAVALGLGTVASAELITLNDFEGATAGGEHMFQEPRFSGSTSAQLATEPNVQEVTAAFPAGLGTGQVGRANFQFVDDATTRWMRHTTFNSAGMPNPAIDLSQPLNFDIYSTVPINVALLVRETGGSGPIGANGGSTGGIEFVGDTATAGAPVGRLVEANTWTTLTFDLRNEPARGFAGASANGTLEGDWGVLEALAITSTGVAGPVDVYYDNFTQGVIPEPATLGLAAVGCLGLLARRRRA